MKKTKFFSIMTLMLALGITACVKPTPQSSEPPAGSSAAPVSSSVAPVSSVTPASSSVKPASSSVKPASSSVKPASSSVKPASSSVKPASSSSEAPVPAMAVSAADFVKVADANFLNLTGTISGFANADAMKMAFGLVHKDAADGGLADPLDGQWLVGSAEPLAADYKYVPVVTAGEFAINIPLAEVVFVKGAYEVYVGPQGHYAKVTLSQANWGNGAVKISETKLKLILRGDRSLIFAEDLPDIALTEATTFVEGEGVDAKVFIQVGGELGIEPEVFLAKVVKVTFERQVGGWAKTEMLTSDATPLVTLVVIGTKGYVKANITALALGGYQVKLGFDGTSAPNTTMDTESYDKRDNPTVLGNKEYAPYYAAGTNDPDHLYGCCGLFIEAFETPITQDTTRLEAENAIVANATVTAKGEDTAVSGESYLAGMTRTSGWNGITSSADFPIKVPATSDYIVNIAYKCPATKNSALSLVVDGGAAKAIGTVAEAWTVASEVINLAADADHIISVRGVSGVTSQLDYIELVKHNHIEGMAFTGDAIEGTAELSAATNGVCTCGKAALKMAASADLNGFLTNGNKLPKGDSKSYDGTKISSYKFNAAKAGTVAIYAEGAFDAAGNDARSYYSGKNGNATFDYDPEAETHPTNTVMKINGVEIVLPLTNYGALLGTTTANQFKLFKIANINVIEGLNEFTITGTNSFGLKYNYFAVLF